MIRDLIAAVLLMAAVPATLAIGAALDPAPVVEWRTP